MRPGGSILALATVVLGFAAAKPRQEDPVLDPKLKPVEGEEGYQKRSEDLYEGMFRRQVSTSDPLSLRALVTSPYSSLTQPIPVKLNWATAGRHAMHLRTTALKERVYYQMDAATKPGVSEYVYSSDLAWKASLLPNDLGFLGWYRESSEDVLVPLGVRASAGPVPSTNAPSVRAILWPEQSCKGVYYAIFATKSDGSLVSVVAQNELKRGSYPAHRAISFGVQKTLEPGLYTLSVSARLSDDSNAAIVRKFEIAKGP